MALSEVNVERKVDGGLKVGLWIKSYDECLKDGWTINSR